jgi:hypothetical protein
MPANRDSLLAGRNARPLEESEIRRAYNTFLGFDSTAPVRYEPGAVTRFRVTIENDAQVEEIVFGPDLYPGQNTINPNSSLSMPAAAAHELAHWYRWRDKTELTEESLLEIDEALTSLEAALRFADLRPHDIRQLMADAIQRLQMFVARTSQHD